MNTLDLNFWWAVGASVLVSSIAFIGIIALALGDRILNRILLFCAAKVLIAK